MIEAAEGATDNNQSSLKEALLPPANRGTTSDDNEPTTVEVAEQQQQPPGDNNKNNNSSNYRSSSSGCALEDDNNTPEKNHTNNPRGGTKNSEETQKVNTINNNNPEEEEVVETLSRFVSSMGRTYIEPTMRTLFLPEPTAASSGNVSGSNNNNNNNNNTDEEEDRDSEMLLLEDSQKDDDPLPSSTHHQQQQEDDDTPSCIDRMMDRLFDPLFALLNDRCRWEISNPGFVKNAFLFVVCSILLQICYLVWGYEQEAIMTTEYNPTPGVPDGKFPSAGFCVFANRLVAVLVAGVVVWLRHGWKRLFQQQQQQETGGGCGCGASLRAFSPCALSSTLSSWFQYSSLRLVSYPVQAVFKSSKIIPVMVLGKVLHGTRYAWGEYAEAFLIGLGVAVFSLAQSANPYFETDSTVLRYFFLLAYVFCDAFTSQWQDKIYHTYGRRNVDVFQMMLGVGFFGLLVSLFGLVVALDDTETVIDFLRQNPLAVRSLLKAAGASALGQLCVFHFIREYGPLVFTVLMTVRQMLSIVVSSLAFGHTIRPLAVVGALVVFATVIHQIRRNYRFARRPDVLVVA